MRAGIPMREADATDLDMYLKVLGQAAKRDAQEREDRSGRARDGKKIVELKRGTIDQFWG